MSTLKFAETHNLVAFLEKPEESSGLEEIIYFLNAKKKKVIITETSIRSDLKLDDAEGIDCLPTTSIFAKLERMSAKTTSWNEFSSTIASAIISLATNQKFNLSKYIFDNMVKNLEGGVKFLMYPSIQEKVLNLEKAKTAQAKEIASLKKRVKQLEKRRKLKTPGLKRLRKIGSTSRVESSNDVSLGAQEDASKLGRKLADLNADTEQEKDVAEKEVSAADPVTTAGEVVTTANVEVTTVNAPTTTIDELTLPQTLIEIKAAKPKAVTSAATTTTTIRPKARGVAKEKGKGIMVEPEVPLKKKDQIAMDEEFARNLKAQLQAKLEEEERISRLKEEKGNIALLESWDNTQAMMDADFKLAQQMQTEEQEKSKLFVEFLEKRRKHFAALRAQEKRSKPPTKAQNRSIMSTYLKNMAGYKHNQLKSKSYDEIQEMFDKEMKRVNTFEDMNSEVMKRSETRIEESSKRAGDELESDKLKNQKIDEHVEVEKDDQEEAEMKRHIEIVKDDEVAIDAIPLATKPPVIVEYHIDKDGRMRYFKLIRADGSSKRYSLMIKMLQGIDREDLETL
ncbi:hypothetical protein Tco_0976779 [Tanacetum coccineum]|uniref:Uncharacterized protein n=1 Tax=Tanacetum coccineum TaxID=301880 RepID=A0ABQ5EJD7_9ASTR